MGRVLLISDIHGYKKELERLLGKVGYREEKDQLVFLGDYVDRGPESVGVLEYVWHEVTNNGAKALLGNHDEMFLYWLDGGELEDQHFRKVGGEATLRDFERVSGRGEMSADELRAFIKQEYSYLIQLLRGLDVFYEHDSFMCSHGGADWRLEDVKKSERDDFVWGDTRDFSYYEVENKTGKYYLFGHIQTQMFRGESVVNNDPIFFKDGKVALDGGVIREEGQLNVVVLGSDGNWSWDCVSRDN